MKDKIRQEVEVLNKVISDLYRVFGIEDLEEALHIDIKFAYIAVLCQISNLKKPTMGELGENSGFQLSTLTRVVDKLVERGLAAREADPSDRRVVRVRITDEGCEIVEKFERERKRKIESALKRLTLKERKDLVRVLQNIHGRIFEENKYNKKNNFFPNK